MKYYLTREQFKKFWFIEHHNWDDKSPSEKINYMSRCRVFEQLYPSLSYKEDPFEENEENFDIPGFYGIVEGDEKDINWFLLQL